MRRLISLSMVLLALPALAQKEEVFGEGKEVKFREETMDKKFAKTQLAKLLKTGSDNEGCVQLMGGLFAALAEIAPVLHKRDESFALDPALQEAVNTQLSPPGFPATAYLVEMVRRVMIDHRLSDEWLETATKINKVMKFIDLPKLRMINEQIDLVDSAYFTIPMLRQRYDVEVLGANSAVTTDVLETFKDAYLDRDVAWGGATLLDVGINQPSGKKGAKKKKYRDAEAEELVAILQWIPDDPRMHTVNLLAQAPLKIIPVIIYVRLQPRQYADIERLHKGQRVLIKGRFWNMNKSATELEIRDGILFDDRDFSGGVLIAQPSMVAKCTAAINELTGVAPQQPGGFHH